MKNSITVAFLALGIFALSVILFNTTDNKLIFDDNVLHKPEAIEEEEYNEDKMKLKMADWSAEDAARQQVILSKYKTILSKNKGAQTLGQNETFGTLQGSWSNRAPKNMPGAFKFAEILDGTDTIYAVSHNHYSGEFNSKSYIYRGTLYNPTTGGGGDNFERITGHWPNRYRDLLAFKYLGKTRLVAGIENGPVYYSDDEGKTWNVASGAPSVTQSTIINRQDGLLYCTDGTSVYVSNDGGGSFNVLENYGSSSDMVLYSPRYNSQPDSNKVYLARGINFYELNGAKTAFTYKGSYSGGTNFGTFSIGGDSRRLYITKNKEYFVSTDGGGFWSVKYPKGNWYGDRSGAMDAGMKISVSPENPLYVLGGYAQPVISTDGLDTDNSTTAGWGGYQNGTSLSAVDYYNRIRFNYHPDFQASHFFYNATGDLFSISCTDGGLFISYKVWHDHPTSTAYNSADLANAHFINITTLNSPIALIYRHNMFTGNKDANHIVYSTQDQGTQDLIPGSTGELLDVYQSIGGDGPPLNSVDGDWVWKWQREGKEVWIPEQLYDGAGNRRQIGTVNSLISSNSSTTFTKTATVGWVQTYIDRDEPSKRMWLLGKSLNRATVNGATISGSTVTKGTNAQISAFAQAKNDPNKVFFLQDGVVYRSTNRGDSFDTGTSTPFSATSNKQNIGGGWVNPSDDNWILFAGPSGNSVGAVLSKDGGNTWSDVTGNLPSGDDFQVGGMVGSPDGQFVFAGTDVGPFVFVVSEEKWYPMFGGAAAMFNTTAIEYIASANTVRFGTWGSGVWDFQIDDGTPALTIGSIASATSTCDSLISTWATNQTGTGTLKLLKGGVEVESWTINDVEEHRFAWLVPSTYATGSDYTLEMTVGALSKTSNTFSISAPQAQLLHSHLSVTSVDSEHNASRVASNSIDNDPSTFWHTEWSPNTPDFPHTIIYSSDTVAEWVAFSYLPRQDGSSNGRVKDYKVYGKNASGTWIELKSGTLSNSSAMQEIQFDQSISTDEIKFEMLSEQGGNFYASMAEFGLFYKKNCGGIVTDVQNISVSMNIFPNPSSGKFVLTANAGISKVLIYNERGKQVKQIPVQSKQNNISIQLDRSGVYFVHVQSGKSTQILKAVVVK